MSAVLWMGAACLAKPTGMCFPFLAVCVWGMAAGSWKSWAAGVRRSWRPLAVCLGMALATGLIAIYSQTHAEGYEVRGLFTASFPWRMTNAIVSAGVYLFQTVWPAGLHLDCRIPPFGETGTFWGIPWRHAIQAVLAWCLAICTVGHCVRRAGNSPIIWGAIGFALFSLAPVLGVFGSFGRAAHADRFTYLPGLAVSLFLLPFLFRIRVCVKRRFQIGVCMVLAGYAVCTMLQIRTFRNDLTAFRRVTACDPLHARAWSHVASEECARLHDFDAGIGHFRDSLALEWNANTAGQLAFALATRGRREDVADIRALAESAGVIRHPESDRKGLMTEALGMAALKDRKWSEAIVFLSATVRAPARLHPADDAYARLGVALANGGRREEAEKLFGALARPGAARPSVRQFALRSLEQLAASGQTVLFY